MNSRRSGAFPDRRREARAKRQAMTFRFNDSDGTTSIPATSAPNVSPQHRSDDEYALPVATAPTAMASIGAVLSKAYYAPGKMFRFGSVNGMPVASPPRHCRIAALHRMRPATWHAAAAAAEIAERSYPTVTGTKLVVSLPKMSITFTATM